MPSFPLSKISLPQFWLWEWGQRHTSLNDLPISGSDCSVDGVTVALGLLGLLLSVWNSHSTMQGEGSQGSMILRDAAFNPMSGSWTEGQSLHLSTALVLNLSHGNRQLGAR